MSNKLVLQNCTVELTMPRVYDVDSMYPPDSGMGKLKIESREYTTDLTVRCKIMEGGKMCDKILTVKRAIVRIVADMLPVVSEDGKTVVLFTTENEAAPDAVVEMGR